MTDFEMLARALRENDGDYPLKVAPQEREQRVVDLARSFPDKTQEEIARESGVAQQTVHLYLRAVQITTSSNLQPEQAEQVQKLPVNKRAALAEVLPKPEPKSPKRQTPAAKAKQQQRQRAQEHLPALAAGAHPLATPRARPCLGGDGGLKRSPAGASVKVPRLLSRLTRPHRKSPHVPKRRRGAA